MSINKNKRKGESLNSPLPSKKQGFKTVLPKRGKNRRKQRIPPIVVSVAVFSGFRFWQIARKSDCRNFPGSFDDRKRLFQYLTEKRQKFFTYDDKTERLFKVEILFHPKTS